VDSIYQLANDFVYSKNLVSESHVPRDILKSITLNAFNEYKTYTDIVNSNYFSPAQLVFINQLYNNTSPSSTFISDLKNIENSILSSSLSYQDKVIPLMAVAIGINSAIMWKEVYANPNSYSFLNAIANFFGGIDWKDLGQADLDGVVAGGVAGGLAGLYVGGFDGAVSGAIIGGLSTGIGESVKYLFHH
jgi:hypothetical protein